RGAFYALTEFNRTSTTRLVGFDQNILAPIRTGQIDSVVVQNTNQMGRAAMELALAESVKCGIRVLLLEVEADNDRAYGLYRSMGFTDTKRRLLRLVLTE
ncbi:MAG: GNAT family N-acetyltransferase, partial [Acidocella sp.]|nr:GNAT family N-acetyltransferase [Acidocella sp.]